ncbi:unnamed protein product [Caenorhabditis angaria]|uniref:Uncharacterized protein n=1 Tax=Caenorhabditis angaria TaxID=860376 RepID=A0A9P1N216_9PELO|nr:unnamed protein product [Caenorhabditis angaria]
MSEIRRRSLKELDEIDISDTDSYNDEMNEIIDDIENDREKEKAVEKNTRIVKIKQTLRDWGTDCSWHGVPHMATSISCFTIFLWTTILLISAVLFCYLVTSTIRQYLRFSKTVDLNIGITSSSFPSTTFCNSNAYKLSAVKAIPELEALLTIYNSA